MAVLRNIVVKIGADISALQSGLTDAQSSLKKMSKSINAVGKDLSASLTVPIAGATTGLLKLGLDFDDAFDKIRVGTGATGEALAGLQDDFKAVYSTVPSGMADVSTAIADLNTRTGMTGKPLQDLASQLLNLSRITGEDLNGMIASSTRLMGDWSISAGKSSSTMDYLFKVSQSTGIGINRLNELMVTFGAPLRQMGFDLQTSAAMLGKFEKEGVNTELVLGGLRKALGTMAKAGVKDNGAALAEITKRIKEAGSAGEANKVAIELFGAKVGPDMAAAIREGRFELTELVDQLNSSPETIKRAAAETADFAEQLTLMKNKLQVALEPLGASLMQAINSAMPAFTAFTGKLVEMIRWFNSLDAGVKTTIAVLLGILAAIGPLTMAVGGLVSGLGSLMGLLSFLISPIGLLIAGVVGLTAVLVYLWNTNDGFKKACLAVWQAVSESVMAAVQAMRDWWDQYGSGILAAVQTVFFSILTVVSSVFSQIVKSLQVFFGYLQPIWDAVKQLFLSLWAVVLQMWELIKPVFETFSAYITIFLGVWSGIFNGLIQALGPFISAVISAVDVIINVIGLIIALLRGDWSSAWEFMKQIALDIWEVGKGVCTTIRNFVKGFVEGVISFFKGLWYALVGGSIVPDMVNGILGWFSNLLGGITSTVSKIVSAVKNAFANVSSTVASVVKSAWSWGSNLVNNLAEGIRSGITAVGSAAKAIANKLKNFLGFHSPTKEGPGSESDQWMPNLLNMFEQGIKAGLPDIRKAALEAAQTLSLIQTSSLGNIAAVPEDNSKIPSSGIIIENVLTVENMQMATDMDINKLSNKIAVVLREQLYLQGVK